MNKAKIIITAFLLCFSFVNADDIINEYRLHGEAAVIQALEEQLQSQAYWMDYLGNQTIEYGYSERPIDLLVCDKYKKKYGDHNARPWNRQYRHGFARYYRGEQWGKTS